MTEVHPENLSALLRTFFGFAGFRANQEAVCIAAVERKDLLLVMPTGSGKSLCYQLPAIALGGTALVISPLIALMEDQAAKLMALGLRVARIHSGLDRAASRQACVDYLQGKLQFLFVAPERLRVPGFPEMLAKAKPALIAIDEAHCISQWGHDFRPDYRMLGQYLPALRPAPVMALTATATPAVQADIVAQLGMDAPKLFIHGFSRENLAIEVVEVPTPARAAAIRGLLEKPERRPAIVYAVSRKQSESLAEELARTMPAAAYHAGLDAETRERVQTRFQRGELRSRGRDDRFRNGYRQGRYPHRDSRRLAGHAGGLLPGDWPRRPRRRVQPDIPDALLCRSENAGISFSRATIRQSTTWRRSTAL